MAAFWEENLHHGVDFQTLLSSDGSKKKAGTESKIGLQWPKDFPCLTVEKEKQRHPIVAVSDRNGQNAITTLLKTKYGKKYPVATKIEMKPVKVDGGIDLMSEDVFTSCEGLLGLGMKAERQQY